MFVMTIDQQGSRRVGDRVDAFLAALRDRLSDRGAGIVRPFERTVGDEVQAVLADPALVVAVGLDVLRWGGWSVGIGAGSVDLPLPSTTRAGSGAAFVLAREAVEAAKSRHRSVPLVVRGTAPVAAGDAESLLVLLAAIRARRTPAGWAAVDALVPNATPRSQDDLARLLGISQQAVSQRLRAALWAEEQAALPLAARLLASADAVGQDEAASGARMAETT